MEKRGQNGLNVSEMDGRAIITETIRNRVQGFLAWKLTLGRRGGPVFEKQINSHAKEDGYELVRPGKATLWGRGKKDERLCQKMDFWRRWVFRRSWNSWSLAIPLEEEAVSGRRQDRYKEERKDGDISGANPDRGVKKRKNLSKGFRKGRLSRDRGQEKNARKEKKRKK